MRLLKNARRVQASDETVAGAIGAGERAVGLSDHDHIVAVDDVRYGIANTGPQPIPEPSTLALMVTGLAGIGWAKKKHLLGT